MRQVEAPTPIYVPGYNHHELMVQDPEQLHEQYLEFLEGMPFRAEIEMRVDPFLQTGNTPMELGDSTGEILFNMRRLQTRVAGHSDSVADLAAAIAQEVGAVEPLHEVHLAGRLHDVWKLGLRDLTDYVGPFSDAQRKKYHEHPTVGAALLSAWGFPLTVVEGARYHHCGIRYPIEAPNYPNVPNTHVPRIGKIMNLADYAVTAETQRSYKKRVGREELINRLHMALYMGKTDEDLVNAYIKLTAENGTPWMRHSMQEEFVGGNMY